MSWVQKLTGGFGPVDVARLLAELGIDGDRRGTKWVACCPDPEHQDRSPSWMIRDEPGERWHGSHNCKSCGFAGGPWELVARVKGIDLDEAAQFVRQLALKPPEEPAELPQVSIMVHRLKRYKMPPGVVFPRDSAEEMHPRALAYLRGRGITDEQIMRWGVGFATVGPLAWRVVLPVYTRNRLVTYAARAVFEDGSRRYDMPTRQSGARSESALWGHPMFDPQIGAVTVAEGVFSAMALERAGAPNPCALLGSEVTPAKIALLESFPVVLIATDPDRAGEKAAAQLTTALRSRSWVERVALEVSPDDYEVGALRDVVTMATGGFSNVAMQPMRCVGVQPNLHHG